MHPIDVVGIGADGWAGLPTAHRRHVTGADVLLGAARLLDTVPGSDQVRLVWPRPLRDGLIALLAPYADRRVTVLASGDPLLAGISSTLIDLFGQTKVRSHPSVSSAALLRARLGWPAETTVTLRAVAGQEACVLRHLAPGARIIVLSADEHTPALLAALLIRAGAGDARLFVGSNLGGPAEELRGGVARSWGGATPRLNIVGIECGTDPIGLGWATGLPDSAFESDGQLTKRDLRASALAHLAPQPRQVLWDVGAGSGAIGIEWMRCHPTCSAYAIEAGDARAQRITRNAANLGVPSLRIVRGHAPSALTDLPTPDAVFIGGGLTAEGTPDACWAALRPGGRMVAHAVTVESEQILVGLHRSHGGHLTRLSVETTDTLGSFTGWKPARTVTQWSVIK